MITIMMILIKGLVDSTIINVATYSTNRISDEREECSV